MKQEPAESPSSAALASRIARYSYGTPSPNRKSPATAPVKREPGPSVSPHFTRTRTRGTDLAPTTIIVRSPHFSQSASTHSVEPQVSEVSEGPGRIVPSRSSDIDDDLESIDGSSEGRPGISSPRSPRENVESDYESDGLGDLISDDSDEEEETTPSRSQTRIQVRRAGRTERHLVREGESGTVTGARKRRKIRREDHNGEAGSTGTPKKKKAPRGYAAPEMYQHLRPLPDLLAPGLDGESSPSPIGSCYHS
jgi:hypothetical protein